jgi:hypothetical protein
MIVGKSKLSLAGKQCDVKEFRGKEKGDNGVIALEEITV